MHYLDRLAKVMEKYKDEGDAVVAGWARLDALPLELVQVGTGWLARKGGFVGLGATEAEAKDELDRTIWLHFTPPGTEWIWNGGQPPRKKE